MKNELYKDNLRDTHWLGEVVDNADPDNFGRCKVKVFGKFDLLDTEAIPWATPMNNDNVGSHHTPNIGDVVAVRFDNGNVYHPEYWFQINQNKELKDEVLDSVGEPENVVSLVYDAKRNIRILINNTHSVPPKIPVYSYHCTRSGTFAKTLPKISHGQERSLFKCKYSKANQQTTKATYPNLFLVTTLIL